ncbi:MAG: type II toxin-antitoxin system RatA family toxin [Pseudomonadota bacterium]|nr:type II toxin-antitoxin system RatA family toxin [Pseudomonadota bacterium]MDP1903413.1 type II toxin-antitoxin system RatA family toxin [Pseudomonadota bacterium]MDP2352383.1 type II toxin-antitoxin system RatA family toxin [Pseudomonadota bacterium]
MAKVVKSVLVPYSAAEMFALVDGVEEYPEFLPWCGGTELHRRDENVTEATIHLHYMQVKQHFTTVNAKRIPEEMGIKLKSGPFRKLEGTWHFKRLAETACKIEFELHYEFSSSLLEKVLGPVFGIITNSMVDAFVHRAENIYGAR